MVKLKVICSTLIDLIDNLERVQVKKDALLSLSGYIYANVTVLPAINTHKNNMLSRLDRSYFLNNDSFYKRNVWVQCSK
ncbi:MAG: hypothetical protein LBG23_04730 [Endomicrobium sp.]|nr:hypothetical protein [Endomicrobium sp.]